MTIIKSAICFLLVGAALSVSAQAAVTRTVSGKIPHLRIEGVAGFIGLPESLSDSACGGRIWVDMNTEWGRSVYATAMMAFATKSTVSLRADNGGIRYFGECPLYDIVVSP